MNDEEPPLVALYCVLTCTDEGEHRHMIRWQDTMAQLEVLTPTQEKLLYNTLLEVAHSHTPHNAEPIRKFLEFFMHPPRHAPTPTNRFVLGFNDELARFATKHTHFLSDITGRLDQPHLQFMMMNVSTESQTVLCKQPNLLLYCDLRTKNPTPTVHDMYRISVNRNYDRLASIFHWMMDDFPGSFRGSAVDKIEFNDLERDTEKKARKERYDARVRGITDNLAMYGGRTSIDNLKAFIRGYHDGPPH